MNYMKLLITVTHPNGHQRMFTVECPFEANEVSTTDADWFKDEVTNLYRLFTECKVNATYIE